MDMGGTVERVRRLVNRTNVHMYRTDSGLYHYTLRTDFVSTISSTVQPIFLRPETPFTISESEVRDT